MKTMKLLPIASATLALGLGAAGTAQAGAYALSYNNIFNLVITPDSGTVEFISFTPISSANANLEAPSTNTGGIGFLDAPIAIDPPSAFNGAGPAENAFVPQGTSHPNYAWADANIPQTQAPSNVGPADSTTAINIAEGNLVTNGAADADSQNSSITGVTFTFDVTEEGQLLIDFDADPFMQALLHADALPGSVAVAELSATASIVDENGITVFEWSPDGVVSEGISGGTESADDADLNLTIQTAIPNTTATYDPTGDASFGGVIGVGGALNFTALTDVLPAGSYTFNLAMEEDVGVVALKQQVPEPATLVLLGLGLVGLGAARSRRNAVTALT